jgi:hypothetical protein
MYSLLLTFHKHGLFLYSSKTQLKTPLNIASSRSFNKHKTMQTKEKIQVKMLNGVIYSASELLQYWQRERLEGRKLVQSVELNVRLPQIKPEPISSSVLLQFRQDGLSWHHMMDHADHALWPVHSVTFWSQKARAHFTIAFCTIHSFDVKKENDSANLPAGEVMNLRRHNNWLWRYKNKHYMTGYVIVWEVMSHVTPACANFFPIPLEVA